MKKLKWKTTIEWGNGGACDLRRDLSFNRHAVKQINSHNEVIDIELIDNNHYSSRKDILYYNIIHFRGEAWTFVKCIKRIENGEITIVCRKRP